MSDIDLLIMPRADLPVIWDAFKAQVEEFRQTAETLIVTDVSQKDKMELAYRTRLTLRKIRIAVEHKRVELGEGHLKEIQKVNGAAKAIREFIEPMEARLLIQESFAERAEEKRIAELTRHRNAELFAIRPHVICDNVGSMSQENYDGFLASLKAEQAEKEEANRLRVEAEKQLAEFRAEAQKRAIELQLELKAESDRLQAVAKAALELAQRVALEEKQRRDAEAEQIRTEQEVKLAAERSAAEAIRTLERVEAEKRRQADLQIEREKTAALEAELKVERAAKQAEADAARKLALAPDIEQLRGFSNHLKKVLQPALKTPEAAAVLAQASFHFVQCVLVIDTFCQE